MNNSENNNLAIKSWAKEDRPREKLLEKGIESLSNAELIAILIGSGNTKESAVDLSKRILQSVKNNLNELAKLSVRDLMQNFYGIGEAKAISIVSALEIGRRRKSEEIREKPKITSSRDIFTLFQPLLGDLPYEEFWALYLNQANRIIEQVKISQGGISGTVMDIRLILKHAIQLLASAIIICHNHPSGNRMPSQRDIEITRKLKDAAGFMEVKVLDHIIIADNSYYSFIDESIL